MNTLYFAYGSNMLSRRISKRIQSAKLVGRASLEDWQVVFNKKSDDGSGKANLICKPGFVTWGAVFEIDADDIRRLDGFEKGYSRTKVNVKTDDGKLSEVDIYISEYLTDDPVAFEDYKNLILEGAREQRLPEPYIRYLQELPSKPKIKNSAPR